MMATYERGALQTLQWSCVYPLFHLMRVCLRQRLCFLVKVVHLTLVSIFKHFSVMQILQK